MNIDAFAKLFVLLGDLENNREICNREKIEYAKSLLGKCKRERYDEWNAVYNRKCEEYSWNTLHGISDAKLWADNSVRRYDDEIREFEMIITRLEQRY